MYQVTLFRPAKFLQINQLICGFPYISRDPICCTFFISFCLLLWLYNLHYSIFQITYAFFCIIEYALHFFQSVFYFRYWIIYFLSGLLYTFIVFSHSVVSNSFWPHGLQHAGLPCPSLSSGVCSSSCSLSWWCHLIISSSDAPFSSCPKSFPALGFFPICQLFASSGQTIGASALVSALLLTI